VSAQETGVQGHQSTVEGMRVFDMQQLNDLMLTQRTKVFKVAVFAQTEGGTTLDSIVGQASDEQRGSNTKRGVADFFLVTFLGGKFREVPEQTTARFFKEAVEFLNDDAEVPDPETKFRYQTALVATLNSNNVDVRPRSFADEHLDLEHRDPFIARLEAKEVPLQPFEKDVKLISGQLKKRQVKFDSGLSLVPSESRKPDDCWTEMVRCGVGLKRGSTESSAGRPTTKE
jgi:hypothetical protein